MLHLIGLGLSDGGDITVNALKAIKTCSNVYLDRYTSILTGASVSTLKEQLEVDIQVLYRDGLEGDSMEKIVEEAKTNDIAILCAGDPLVATTHNIFILESLTRDVKYKVYHCGNILTALAVTGIDLYSCGYTVTLPGDQNIASPSVINRIRTNYDNSMHTIVLLDIKIGEDNLGVPLPKHEISDMDILPKAYFMRAHEAAKILITTDETLGNWKAFACARIGGNNQDIRAGTLNEIANMNLGDPLHCLVLLAPRLSGVEMEFFDIIKNKSY